MLPLPANPTIILMPHTILMHAVKEIFAGATLGNTWTNRTLRKIRRTGIDGSIPISTPIHGGMNKYPTPASSDSTGTRGTGNIIPIRTTDSPCGVNMSPKIDSIQQSANPDLIKSNKLDTSID